MDDGAACYRRFLEGDESGFSELVTAYGGKLIFFINRFVGNLSVAEDLMEDTFCDLIVCKNRYKGKSQFKTYLFAVARHKAADYLRRLPRQAGMPLEEADRAEEKSLEARVIADERGEQVNAALEKLSPDYRAVLHLLYFEEMPYGQAGAVLRKTPKQIKNLAYRARQALKTEMEQEGFVYEES